MNRRQAMILVQSLLVACCGGNDPGKASLPEPTVATVYKTGDTIVYNGPICEESNAQAAGYIDKKVKKIQITSRGGEIVAGMQLGELVHVNALTVEVDRYCFSSCANYVFPAGKTKILHSQSQLGWHGGALQKMEISDPAMSKLYEDYVRQARQREAAYFQMIGVDQQSTVYGQRGEFARFADCLGWRYSMRAMARLGIHNIVLQEDAWNPDDTFEGACIFTIDDVQL